MFSVDTHLKVQVRAERISGVARLCDGMSIQRRIAIPIAAFSVVNDNIVSVPCARTGLYGFNYRSFFGCHNRHAIAVAVGDINSFVIISIVPTPSISGGYIGSFGRKRPLPAAGGEGTGGRLGVL